MPEDKRHVGAQAHRNAINRLVSTHQEEFNKILADERVKLGLSPESRPPKKLSRLEQLREQLRQAGVEPTV